MGKYHVALSFAGEDREYVEAVAKVLRREGVRVFYDKFEDVSLWGKDLYEHLSDIYQNQAMYTVMFISKAYRDKLWGNHERKAAQARAFAENKEYILPAVFDKSVEIKGVLRTTGYISLGKLTPQQFAQKIITKLRNDKVSLIQEKFAYSVEATADVDFPLPSGTKITKILDDLRSYNWYTQNPAIQKIFSLDWDQVTPDQTFVLGRNIYQCACGNEHRSVAILENLRQELARFPIEVVEHLLNGMLFEAYFDSKGAFRGNKLKGRCLAHLFAIQTAEKDKDSIAFIGQVLAPYRDKLLAIPNAAPERVEVKIEASTKSPALVKSIKCFGHEVLVKAPSDNEPTIGQIWKLSFKGFSLEQLRESLAEAWFLPAGQIELTGTPKLRPKAMLRLPEDKTIAYPTA